MECRIKGLRSQESEKFNRFWDLVQDEAATQGCVFFGDCGEGRDLVTEELEGENFSGWLIPKAQERVFEDLWRRGAVPDDWLNHMVWMEWEQTPGNAIKIKFEHM